MGMFDLHFSKQTNTKIMKTKERQKERQQQQNKITNVAFQGRQAGSVDTVGRKKTIYF